MKTYDDVYDIKKNGALVIGKNRLDDYATKFLTKYCPETLLQPMRIPVDDILIKLGLKVVSRTLSKNLDIFGCCTMFDCEIEVYKYGKYHNEKFKDGTIIIDPKSETLYGKGQERNTLMHEIIHWEKDKRYFEILNLNKKFQEEKISPLMCRQSKKNFEPSEKLKTKDNEVNWLEWQANRLAPRILMPKEMFKEQAIKYMHDNEIRTCDMIINKLSRFFGVSRLSVKYRLLEVGLKDLISNYEDYRNIYNDEDAKDYAKISIVDAYKLIEKSASLKEWVKSGRFTFADGYFVLTSEEYIKNDDGILKLTKKAKANLKKCAINIRKIDYTEFYNKERNFSIFYKTEGSTNTLYMFSPEFQEFEIREDEEIYQVAAEKIFSNDIDEKKLTRILNDPDKTLCDGIVFLMESKGWDSPQKFSDRTLLAYDYYARIKNNKNNKMNNMNKATLMAICVGLELKLRITQQLFDKSNNKLNNFNEPDKSYIRILESVPWGLKIDDFNELLKQNGQEPLGSKEK